MQARLSIYGALGQSVLITGRAAARVMHRTGLGQVALQWPPDKLLGKPGALDELLQVHSPFQSPSRAACGLGPLWRRSRWRPHALIEANLPIPAQSENS